MDAHNNGVNELIQHPKDTKKTPPKLNPRAFTGEEDVDSEGSVTFTQLLEFINSCRIDLTEELPPPPVALQVIEEDNSVTLFTKGNFSIVTGAAKSRKTFLLSMLIAAAIKGSLQDKLLCPTSGINLLFDTEQSRYKAHQVAKRICTLADKPIPENFQAYSLRKLEPHQRLSLIEYVLANTPNLNFVAIDGIIDLGIDPIMQSEQAQRIIHKLMVWSELYNTHIACVLHYNKNMATLLGHLGSQSNRKADAIIAVTKSKNDEGVSFVEPVECREKDFKPFAFAIDSTEMPYILKDYVIKGKSKIKKEIVSAKLKPITPDLTDQQIHQEILSNTFKVQKKPGYRDLWNNIKDAVKVVTGQSIGDNKAKDFVSYYLDSGSILKVDITKKNVTYIQPEQSNADF